jgi:hypothetical protein
VVGGRWSAVGLRVIGVSRRLESGGDVDDLDQYVAASHWQQHPGSNNVRDTQPI